MDILIPILIIAVLILLNGLFVAAEFAIIGAPRAIIERRAAEGHRIARVVNQMLHNPTLQDRYIATAQLGITFASLGLGMYGEHILAEWLAGPLERLGAGRWIAAHTLATIVAITILTYFHIVVGEMVPKSLALQHAEDTVLRVTPPMLWVKTAMYPLVLALNGIGNGILRLMGIRRELSTGHYHTPQELEYVVQESEAGGLLRAESGRILRDLFEFGDRTAGETMVPRVKITALPLASGLEELRAIVRRARHTRYPVIEGDMDNILGMVHIKDVLRLFQDGQTLHRADLRPLTYVPATMTLDSVLEAMQQARTQMVIVMDEHGGTAGLLTIENIFEEVIGDIEEGTDSPDTYRDAAQQLHVAGTMRIDAVGEHFGRVLEHADVDTVSGLVLALLERPAVVGDAVTFDGLQFAVARVAGRGVEECIVTPLPQTDTPPETQAGTE